MLIHIHAEQKQRAAHKSCGSLDNLPGIRKMQHVHLYVHLLLKVKLARLLNAYSFEAISATRVVAGKLDCPILRNLTARPQLMRKVIFVVMLAAASSSAMAEWVEVNDNNKFTLYADLSTVRKMGDKVTMWLLYDFKIVQKVAGGSLHVSSKSQHEYGCNEKNNRILFISRHSDNMGRGDLVWLTSEEGSWKPIPTGSITEKLWKTACGKR